MNKILIYHLFYFPQISRMVKAWEDKDDPEWAWTVLPRILKEWYGRDIAIEWDDPEVEGYFWLFDDELVHWDLKMKYVVLNWSYARWGIGDTIYSPKHLFKNRNA